MRVCVTAAVLHSRVVYGFSNEDYRYCASARRPLDGTFNLSVVHLQYESFRLVLIIQAGYTALMNATNNNKTDVVKELISLGADVDIQDNVGFLRF